MSSRDGPGLELLLFIDDLGATILLLLEVDTSCLLLARGHVHRPRRGFGHQLSQPVGVFRHRVVVGGVRVQVLQLHVRVFRSAV